VTRLAVHWLDVFTEVPFAGNQLAVLPDADGLSDEQMQTIAKELGLAETVFVHGGAERLRIFTPAEELPLAGHPVVGTTIDLARIGRIARDGTHVFATGVGETPIEIVGGELAWMTQAPLEVGDELDAATVAGWLGVAPDGLVGTPRFYSTTGMRQLFARVRDRETLAGLSPDQAAIAAFDADGIVAWCEHGDELAQRFFAPRIGIAEDAATGSAAGAVGALRVHAGAEPGEMTVRQGAEMGRPSEIHVEVTGEPGAPDPPRVGGRAVLVLEGELAVDGA
jgi:trans-2,3-dihydro-3-hydroxyanthranilate isomerase